MLSLHIAEGVRQGLQEAARVLAEQEARPGAAGAALGSVASLGSLPGVASMRGLLGGWGGGAGGDDAAPGGATSAREVSSSPTADGGFRSTWSLHLKSFGLADDFCNPDGDLGRDPTERTEDQPVVSKTTIDKTQATAAPSDAALN